MAKKNKSLSTKSEADVKASIDSGVTGEPHPNVIKPTVTAPVEQVEKQDIEKKSEVKTEIKVDSKPREPKLFFASAGTDVRKLGSAIANELYGTLQVDIRAIGIQAVNQTVKAIAIASSFLSQRGRGYKVLTDISFRTVPSEKGDSTTVTAMYFECYKVLRSYNVVDTEPNIDLLQSR